MRGTGSWWSSLTRAAAVFGVLLGVFVMHGLTGDHDVTMVQPAAAGVPAVGSGEGDRHSVAARSHAATAEVPAFIPVDEHHHAMGDVCLAVLTSLLLLLALILAIRSLLVWRAIPCLTRIELPRLSGRSPPGLTPSLSKLCVLRT